MSRADQKHLTELQMGCNADRNVLSIRTYADGTTYIAVSSPNGWSNFDTTLGQAIQLRDFLNRHIDELALKQTGSLAQRASDDQTQLAAVEEIASQIPCDPDRGLRPGYLKQDVIDRVATEGDQRLQTRVSETRQ